MTVSSGLATLGVFIPMHKNCPEAFSNGVFAIAITSPILDIRVPEVDTLSGVGSRST